mmetsp:Transcript_148012/g.368909  ORF Transcript_148012/g.368909 Transcript_148012/m.368909 type:complete len:281 (-) Transcript_148012:3119-3961(-)
MPLTLLNGEQHKLVPSSDVQHALQLTRRYGPSVLQGPRRQPHGSVCFAVEQCHPQVREGPYTRLFDGATGAPGKRACGVVPADRCGSYAADLISHGLSIVLHNFEGAIGTHVDLHLQRATGQQVGGLHHWCQRQNGTWPDKDWDLIRVGFATQVHRSLDHVRGVEVVPPTFWQVDLPTRILTQHRSHKERTVHPLSREGRGQPVVWELHGKWPHPQGTPREHGVSQRVVVGDQAVSELQSLAHGLGGLPTEKPRPMRLRPKPRVHAHRGQKDANLHPAYQ